MPDNPDQFSAADSALGYLYQVRCALLWSLQRLPSEPEFEVSIETIDDVTFETADAPHELLQTKLHKNRGANLTDASPDLWKTLRIWIAALDGSQITKETVLYLVTNEKAIPGTIAGNLKTTERNTTLALQRLEKTAQKSINTTISGLALIQTGKDELIRIGSDSRVFSCKTNGRMRNASLKDNEDRSELPFSAAPLAACQRSAEQNAGFRRLRSSCARSSHVFMRPLLPRDSEVESEIRDANLLSVY